MRIGHVLRAVGSGAVIYIAMAACGAGGATTASSTSGGDPGGDGSSGGTSGTSGSSGRDATIGDMVDAFVDALANPVKDANAGPLPPDIATENCDKVGGSPASPTSLLYAVHAYPGKSISDLASVHVIVNGTATQTTVNGDAYSVYATFPYIRAGSVAVVCGSAASPANAAPVIFVLPQ